MTGQSPWRETFTYGHSSRPPVGPFKTRLSVFHPRHSGVWVTEVLSTDGYRVFSKMGYHHSAVEAVCSGVYDWFMERRRWNNFYRSHNRK